jgi:hypothetical protein
MMASAPTGELLAGVWKFLRGSAEVGVVESMLVVRKGERIDLCAQGH